MKDDLVDHMQQQDASRNKRRKHAVIFFINASTIATDDKEEMRVVKENCIKVRYLIYLIAQSCANAQAADKLGVAQKDFIFGLNYTEGEERDFQVDRVMYKILEMALHRAHDFCQLGN